MAIVHVPYYLSKAPSPLSTCRLAANRISEFSMEKVQCPEDKRVNMREAECKDKEASESNPTDVKRLSDNIMPHLLNLYGSRATSQDFEIYHADASFEDPLMCAHGVKQIKSAFYSLSKSIFKISPVKLVCYIHAVSCYRRGYFVSFYLVFSESRIVEYSITENAISAGKQEILIDNKQQYKFLGRNIDMISLIRLYVEDGKVVRHEDWWDKKPLRNRDTVKLPFVGRMLELTRRGSMLATHALMRFGKDPAG